MKPPQGYDYLAPVGYKAGENPTFPSKLYEAAEEILVVRPTLRPTVSPAIMSAMAELRSYLGSQSMIGNFRLKCFL